MGLGWVMIIILMVLFFVMMFGIGFILNMLMKTTWFPVGFFVIIVFPATFYLIWDESLSWGENIAAYGPYGFLTAVAGFAGAIVSGMTIEALRKSGYKMY
ncbi:YuiB family protein [Paenibacillus sp. 481]|uniref:YuiB family protein n=1 Tax=Paenibacillus sp. 481 TaxID=2835869 RepID=UPI002FC30621